MFVQVINEAERRRVGTLLATQILRRSTFSCYFTTEQIMKIIGWFPREHRVEACVVSSRKRWRGCGCCVHQAERLRGDCVVIAWCGVVWCVIAGYIRTLYRL